MIELGEEDGVALIRMADGKANAMSLAFCQELTARFKEAAQAPAVVLTGSGHIFSAGVDLKRLIDGGAPYIREFLPVLSAMFAAVFSHPRPVVAAINGHAIAGGCVLACAADKRLMARDAGRIGVTELLVGVAFPPVAMEIMRCATAPQYFEDAIFGAATYAPPEAAARGFVHDIVDPHALLERAVACEELGGAVAGRLRAQQAADARAGAGTDGGRRRRRHGRANLDSAGDARAHPRLRRAHAAQVLKHDSEKCAAVFGKDHAQTGSWSGMTVQRKVIPL
jgi:enoyl-CoA hydratase/carnithine racemase